jgi:hypothetical protein
LRNIQILKFRTIWRVQSKLFQSERDTWRSSGTSSPVVFTYIKRRNSSTSFFFHTWQNATQPQHTETLTAGTSPTPDLPHWNRSSEPARHAIVMFSFVQDINIVTWRWPSMAETCSQHRRNKYNTKTVVFLTDHTSFF